MPTYEYKCSNGHTFEEIQRMSDDPLTECTQCGAPVERVFHPIAVHFKGSGFYTTDYGSKSKSKGSGSSEGGESKSDEGSGAKSGDGESKSSGGSDSGSSSSGEKTAKSSSGSD